VVIILVRRIIIVMGLVNQNLLPSSFLLVITYMKVPYLLPYNLQNPLNPSLGVKIHPSLLDPSPSFQHLDHRTSFRHPFQILECIDLAWEEAS
jgi:hypothetical protein